MANLKRYPRIRKVVVFFIELVISINVHYHYVVNPRKLWARRELNGHAFSVQLINKIVNNPQKIIYYNF